jgi:hypothetical protein
MDKVSILEALYLKNEGRYEANAAQISSRLRDFRNIPTV